MKVLKTCEVASCSTRTLVTDTLCKDHYRESVYTGEPLPLDVLAVLMFPPTGAPNHNLTRERWERMFFSTDGLCHLCGDAWQEVIDHDHACEIASGSSHHLTCGKCVRGLLCTRCNNLLGTHGDSIESLRAYSDKGFGAKAIAYLERYSEVRAAGRLIGE